MLKPRRLHRDKMGREGFKRFEGGMMERTEQEQLEKSGGSGSEVFTSCD